MLPAAQPPACHDRSLATCLGEATLRAGLKPVCSLLQSSLKVGINLKAAPIPCLPKHVCCAGNGVHTFVECAAVALQGQGGMAGSPQAPFPAAHRLPAWPGATSGEFSRISGAEVQQRPASAANSILQLEDGARAAMSPQVRIAATCATDHTRCCNTPRRGCSSTVVAACSCAGASQEHRACTGMQQSVWTWGPSLMLPAAQPPAFHDRSLATCLGEATPRAGLKPVCSLLQSSLPSITKRITTAFQTAFNVKKAATRALSEQTRQRSHEVASRTTSRPSVLHGVQWGPRCIFDALMVKAGPQPEGCSMSCLPGHVCCVSVRPTHAATAHGT